MRPIINLLTVESHLDLVNSIINNSGTYSFGFPYDGKIGVQIGRENR